MTKREKADIKNFTVVFYRTTLKPKARGIKAPVRSKILVGAFLI